MYLFLSFSDPTRERWMFWFGSCASSEAACLCRNLTSCLLLFPPRRLLWFPLIYSAVKTLLSLRRWRAGKEVTRRLSCGWRRAKTIRILPSYHVLIAERGWMCCDVAAHFVPFVFLNFQSLDLSSVWQASFVGGWMIDRPSELSWSDFKVTVYHKPCYKIVRS